VVNVSHRMSLSPYLIDVIVISNCVTKKRLERGAIRDNVVVGLGEAPWALASSIWETP
jgi:hypothetical protein